MKAKLLIRGASFGHDALEVIGQAFDQAWSEIGHVFDTPELREAARLTLAKGILAAATNESRDVRQHRLVGIAPQC